MGIDPNGHNQILFAKDQDIIGNRDSVSEDRCPTECCDNILIIAPNLSHP